MAGQILIVDDNAAVRSLLTLLVRRAGFEVDTAEDGVEALEKLRDGTYWIVLLDLMMPRMNGYEVVEQLRRIEDRPAVIAITAAIPSAPDLDPAVVHAVVRKPFDIELLGAVIVDCARQFAAQRGSTSRPGDGVTPLNGSVN
ncbi:MAG TPA: response regulator [Thermoanaerobaculia bacterium]|nr:response regulator [Thermoanaerobaculia bacterium]